MIKRVLVAVDDSPAGLAAARVAVGLAADVHGDLLAVHVLTDGVLAEALSAASRQPNVAARRDAAAESMLRHVAALAERAGVPAQTRQLEGEIARCVLREARRWPADVIVIGRTARHRAGEPFLGADAQHVVEFAEQPVLIVPQMAVTR